MNRTEDLLAALAPFLRKDYSGAEHDTSNTEEVNREARARVTATMVGRVAGRKEEDERHLFELSRVLVEGLYKSFIGLHKWVSLGLVEVGRSVNDGGDEPSDDIRTRCLAALEGYVNAVAEGLDYVMKNKLVTASFISVFKKLKVKSDVICHVSITEL